jgi:hypothetical protein
MLGHFYDVQDGFFDSADDHEPLLLRPQDVQDNATPSGSALAVQVLLQLAAYGDRPQWQPIALQRLTLMADSMRRYPTAFAKWLLAAEFALGRSLEVAILGDPASPSTRALLDTLWQSYRPQLVAAIANDPPPPGSAALLKERPLVNGQPTAFVCQGFVCCQPVYTPDKLSEQLAG